VLPIRLSRTPPHHPESHLLPRRRLRHKPASAPAQAAMARCFSNPGGNSGEIFARPPHHSPIPPPPPPPPPPLYTIMNSCLMAQFPFVGSG
jgi:hypothetical protein